MLNLAERWLPPFLVPFFTLSYKTEPPLDPDSFPHELYYNTGPKDVCFIIGCIAVMAVLRDAFRLGVFEPFARWKLTRDADNNRSIRVNGNGKLNGNGAVNGNGNGHAHSSAMSKRDLRRMHRTVLRFAEQGWPAVYYPLNWSYGLVGPLLFSRRAKSLISLSTSTITFQPECLSPRTCG